MATMSEGAYKTLELAFNGHYSGQSVHQPLQSELVLFDSYFVRDIRDRDSPCKNIISVDSKNLAPLSGPSLLTSPIMSL
jgi:hypothetical protein